MSKAFVILGKIRRGTFINVYRSSCKVLVIIVRFNGTWIFSTDFLKNTQISNFIKFRPIGAALFRADTQTDRQT